MTASELGTLVAERQFRATDQRVACSIAPALPIFTLRRGQALTVDTSGMPATSIVASGFLGSAVLAEKLWRVEGFGWTVSRDNDGALSVSSGGITAEEVLL